MKEKERKEEGKKRRMKEKENEIRKNERRKMKKKYSTGSGNKGCRKGYDSCSEWHSAS